MSAFIGAVNVHDYAAVPGQIGQGATDDTQAIKDAILALTQMTLFPSEIGTTLRTSPTLYFPAGIYNITDQIEITSPLGCVKVLGENAIIRPNPDVEHPFVGEYAFLVEHCEDFRLINLNFVKFDKAVRLENNNPNAMQVMVEECGFVGNNVALEMSCQSTIAVIEKCKFFENKKAIHLFSGDKVTIKDCWIEAAVMSDTIVGGAIIEKHPAQIINSAKLTIEGCVLTPHAPVDATEPAWINNYASVTIKDTRQGGEFGGFTLVNNFAPVGGADANAVIVKDCECAGTYNSTPDYRHPAVLRYVTKIPNLTVIRNNRGLVDCGIVDFSKDEYGDSHDSNPTTAAAATAAINNMIANSGTTGATVATENVIVEVANNERGLLVGGRASFVPKELYPYVRDEESLWPDSRRSNALKVESTFVNPDDSIVYTFDYGPDFNTAYLINFKGCPNPGASGGVYSGGYVGILKANGFWAQALYQALVLEPVFNQIGSTLSGSYPMGQFVVTAYWEVGQATESDIMLNSEANRRFCIKVVGRSGANGDWDRIKVTSLDSL